MPKRAQLTTARKRLYQADAKTINFYRNNPIIACEDLLGIYLSDAQAWMLQSSWNTLRSIWSCSRNFGKSFLIAIICILRAVLYENQNIYIVSSVGGQAKETFQVVESIVTRTGKTSNSIPDLKDIILGEMASTAKNPTGFKHDPAGYSCEFHNGSKIMSLNAAPDNIRGKRSSLTVFDEAAFCSEELIHAVEPFSTQDSDAQYGKDTALLKDTVPRKPHNCIIYASSQDTMDTVFYQHFKEFAKYMIAGDHRYFVCDMPCVTAMEMYHKGNEIPPLLSKSVVDAALKSNPEKARREYYNKPDLSGGDNQIIKWGVMRRNERQIIPTADFTGNNIVLAFDPARTIDNSVVGAMEIYNDDDLGLCGRIIGCFNFIDIASSKKYKLDSNRQIDELRNIILRYNGNNNLDYEYIDSFMIDSGSGGGGMSTYADALLNDWEDVNGTMHKGLIDRDHDVYVGYTSMYPNALNKLKLINPRKMRTQMIEAAIELMELGVVHFPYQYNGQEYIQLYRNIDEKTGEEISESYRLSQEEMVLFKQIDLMKNEICTFHRSVNAEGTNVQYALAKEKQHTMHDDRAYTFWMLCWRLYELRRGKAIRNSRDSIQDSSAFIQFRAPKIF